MSLQDKINKSIGETKFEFRQVDWNYFNLKEYVRLNYNDYVDYYSISIFEW